MTIANERVSGAPTIAPWQHVDPRPAGDYRPEQAVWAYWDGAWRPAEVGATGPLAVLVRYELAGGGSAVNTVMPDCIMPRESS